MPYAEQHVARGGRLNNIARHILGLYHGEPGARAFRRLLSEQAVRDGADAAVLVEASALMRNRERPTFAGAGSQETVS